MRKPRRVSTTPVSIRLTTAQLDFIDAWINAQERVLRTALNRSEVMAAAAAKVGRELLKREAPPLLLSAKVAKKLTKKSSPTTISVSFTSEQLEVIRNACTALNQRFSPFVVWAVLTIISGGTP